MKPSQSDLGTNHRLMYHIYRSFYISCFLYLLLDSSQRITIPIPFLGPTPGFHRARNELTPSISSLKPTTSKQPPSAPFPFRLHLRPRRSSSAISRSANQRPRIGRIMLRSLTPNHITLTQTITLSQSSSNQTNLLRSTPTSNCGPRIFPKDRT